MDPVLELYDQTGALIATNDNWDDNFNQQEIIDTGIPPASPDESVILARLPSDDSGVAYTAVLRGAGNTTGVAVLELYDFDQGLGSRVLNISTRGRVDVGDNVMIGALSWPGRDRRESLSARLGRRCPLPEICPTPR